jgi:hypothetical protein
MSTEKPLGIIIIVILDVLGAIYWLGIGGLLVGGAGLFAMLGEFPGMEFLAGLFMAIGAIAILIGIVGLITAWGLWTGQGWGWTLGLVLAIISLILSLPTALAGVGIVPIIIDIVIIYYLTTPHVKAFFGKGPSPEAPPPPPP